MEQLRKKLKTDDEGKLNKNVFFYETCFELKYKRLLNRNIEIFLKKKN